MRSKKRILLLIAVGFVVLVLIVSVVLGRDKDSNGTGGNLFETSNDDPSTEEPSIEQGDQMDDNGNDATDEKLRVYFLTDEGVPILIQECQKGQTLIPPAPPQRIGYVFTGWSGNYSNITQNTEIIANYMDVSKITNAIGSDTVYALASDEFEVTVGIYGEVNFCGLDMDIEYDSSLLLYIEAVEVDDFVILNDTTSGVIHTNYVSTNNTSGEVSFVTLKFKVKTTDRLETALQFKVNSIYSLDDNDTLTRVEYQILQNKIIGGT